MAMRKSSCKNTPQYLRSFCSPIGQNNTNDFSAQSGGSIGRAVWKRSGKSRFPGYGTPYCLMICFLIILGTYFIIFGAYSLYSVLSLLYSVLSSSYSVLSSLYSVLSLSCSVLKTPYSVLKSS